MRYKECGSWWKKGDSDMTNIEKIRLCQKVLDEIQEESKRPVCRLRFSKEDYCITDSHLGGVPYLPKDGVYPMGESGQILWLCAQINFAQMPPIENFPKEGILQFFLSDWEYDGGFGLYENSIEYNIVQGHWKVYWYPKIDSMVTKEECFAKMPVAWEAKKELWRTPDEPLKMSFLPIEQEGVTHEDFRFDILFESALKQYLPEADLKEFEPYGALWKETQTDVNSPNRKALQQILEQMQGGGCKIGGYPTYCQSDPRWYGDNLSEWDTLLFQLDDDTFTYEAGDVEDFNLNGGTLNFLIRLEDLKNRDFSRVLADWACT